MTSKSVPFGYRKNEDGEIVEVAHQQRAIQLIQKLRDKGYSLQAIAAELEAKSVLTKKSGKSDTRRP